MDHPGLAQVICALRVIGSLNDGRPYERVFFIHCFNAAPIGFNGALYSALRASSKSNRPVLITVSYGNAPRVERREGIHQISALPRFDLRSGAGTVLQKVRNLKLANPKEDRGSENHGRGDTEILMASSVSAGRRHMLESQAWYDTEQFKR